MTADLVARLESVADDVDPNKSPGRSHREIAAEIRSIASALRSSGEAVVRGGSWIHEVAGKMVQDHYDNSGTLLSRIPFLHGLDGMDDALAFPATPATVTDEDVERAADAFLANTGQEHKVTPLQRSLTIQCMRPALESFVRKQPAASAALERV